MGKKREKRKVVRYIYEGKLTERVFFDHIRRFYPESNAEPYLVFCGRGGTANSQVSNVLKVLYFDRIYLILDEDFQTKGPIEDDVLRKLEAEWILENGALNGVRYRDYINYNKGRRPIIIFSNPSSIEGVILQILGKSKKSLEGIDTDNLKSQLSSYVSQYFLEKNITLPHSNEEKLREFFAAKFSNELLQSKRKTIKELDCILSIFE
ncbi:MAG: hypothetical protein IJ564_04715 [Alphaproteobacteria bacterium]|nr:hypothetical protein [Alphaproteobacteria bacterium]